ncbi:MAG: nicotinate phosphoribosyltransferase, partial [Microbacteriaceae bacterium]|nr:nicotinate phosphoribosyltransferase [Microbacteriaceae bacterium]
PAAGMVYKLVAKKDAAGDWISVAKTSPEKASIGGRKFPVRELDETGTAIAEVIHVGEPEPTARRHRPLLVPLITGGIPVDRFRGEIGTVLAREHRAAAIAELPAEAFRLGRGEPVIPTRYA